ncbi:MAG: ATP-binding protein [Acidobacteria bacterium]|nr:ATP-binding protein [Acidobacteriota bacterium]
MGYEREQVGILRRRLEEEPRTIQIVLGPRQSGKTTIVTQALRTLTGPWHYFDVDSADNDLASPVLPRTAGPQRSPDTPRSKQWLIDVWRQARADATRHDGSVLALDELQSIPDWSSTVKGLWDGDRLNDRPLHVVILGSAPMAIQSSLKESMTGRFEIISVGHWSFSEMREAFGFDLQQYLYFGGYPGAVRLAGRWPPDWPEYEPRWRDYVRTSFVGPAIERDVLAMTRVDKPALLGRLFELGAAYSGQILPLHKMLGQLQDAGNATTLARYLDLLSQVGLITGLPKYTPSMLRLRASPPKFNVLNTALMTVGSNRSFEDARADRRFWGRLVESAVGAHLLNTSGSVARVHYWREGDDEVDFVIQQGLRTVAIEVKTGHRPRPTKGMRVFGERHRPYRTLLLTETGEPHGSIPLEVFLSRPASAWLRSEFVQRTCTEVIDAGNLDHEETGKPLSEYDTTPAYVLLADAGMGKTTCFREACRSMGEQGHMISARDFVTLDTASHPEWRNKTLFIDGLDEIRAGRDDARTPLDEVRRQLDRLGSPSFRLSCREADWLGKNDQERLDKVAPGGNVAVLRLDPLSHEDVLEVAESRLYLQDGKRFLKTAEDKGLGLLIRNPQNLELVAAATRAGEWPENRAELFELACRSLVCEPNDEHLNARIAHSQDLLLRTAGRLCSLLLLSGTAGIRLSSAATGSSGDYRPADLVDPAPPGVSPGDVEAWSRQQRAVLSSRLFRAAVDRPPSERSFEPVHRHIAEFLAGRYLAQQIEDGLPPARVVALVTAGEGSVVTAHRGLAAWLGAYSQHARRELIHRDPLGVGLYGDISGFSTDQKRALLRALIREGRRLHSVDRRTAAAFAPIATPVLEAELRGELGMPLRTDDNQLSVEFVLKVLSHGVPMPALAEACLSIVHDSGAWPRVTYAALDAFLRQCPNTDTIAAKLLELLASIQQGHLTDSGNELAARILDHLYPDVIGPAEVWSHLAHSQPTRLIGRHRRFWCDDMEARIQDADVPRLMDGLARHASELREVLDRREFPVVAARLLARGLGTHGDELKPSRLYDWLCAPAESHEDFFGLRRNPEAPQHLAAVRHWLEQHPDAFKATLLEGLLRCADSDDLHAEARLVSMKLQGAATPVDFGAWSLERAGALANTQPALAKLMFNQARHCLDMGETGSGLSQALIDECLRQHPDWQPASPAPEPESSSELREQASQHATQPAEPEFHRVERDALAEQRERRERQWLDAVRAEVPALGRNRGAPWLLHDLAGEWLQQSSWKPIPLSEWLRAKFGEEDELAVATLRALLKVIDRDDLPDMDEILRLRRRSHTHYLGVPFLVALEERDREQGVLVKSLSDNQLRLALVFHYCVPTGRSFSPKWYRQLLSNRTELVASVLLPLIRADIQSGREHVSGVAQLVHDEDYAELARMVSVPLLSGFPVRCPARRLPNLIRLLWAALRHADRGQLVSVIQTKLAAKSMTTAQRVHWLGAGLVAAPQTYAEQLDRFVAGKELRAGQLADFLRFEELFQPDKLPPCALETLIRQLGRGFGPIEPQDGPVDVGQWTLWHVPDLIQHLLDSPRTDAASSLHRLANDESLSHWRHHLRIAFDRRVVADRDSSYKRPELDQIRATLDNRGPANAADLAALALDRLDELAGAIRHANTNEWRQYWNEDTNGQPVSSKHEESCRDTLLSRLRFLLRDELHDQPEAAAAAKKRADIGLFGPNFHVPIEIKKQSNPGLWRAARDQLVAKYTQDPATDGYGIYLVFWFGEQEKTPLDETGTRPGSPGELQQRLEDCLARQLPLEQRRKIGVRVIDVSKP